MVTDQEFMDLLEVLHELSSKIDEKFANLEGQLADLKQEMNSKFELHEKWLKRIDATLIDHSLKFKHLLTILEQKQIISTHEASIVLTSPTQEM